MAYSANMMANPALAKFAPIIAAQQQQELNKTAAQDNTVRANPNVNTAFGSQTVTYGPNGQPTVTKTLSPQEQQNYDLYNRTNQAVSNSNIALAGNRAAQGALTQQAGNRVAGTIGSAFNPQVGSYKTSASYGQILNDLNTGAVGLTPEARQAERAQASDAAYRAATRYMDPQYNERQNRMENQLANQGVVRGSEAWSNALNEFNTGRDRDYAQARDLAFSQGLTSLDSSLRDRAQLWSEVLGAGQFHNNAQQQGFSQALSNANLNNQVRQNRFNEEVQKRAIPMNEYAMLLGNMPGYGGMQQYQAPDLNAAFDSYAWEPMNLEGAVGDVMGNQASRSAASKSKSGAMASAGIGAAGSIAAAAAPAIIAAF